MLLQKNSQPLQERFQTMGGGKRYNTKHKHHATTRQTRQQCNPNRNNFTPSTMRSGSFANRPTNHPPGIPSGVDFGTFKFIGTNTRSRMFGHLFDQLGSVFVCGLCSQAPPREVVASPEACTVRISHPNYLPPANRRLHAPLPLNIEGVLRCAGYCSSNPPSCEGDGEEQHQSE